MAAPSAEPFVGLRPFEEEDAHLFFGRRDQLHELLERLKSSRLVAVVGSSGCGKSSLVRAGLVPALKAGFLVRSRASWEVLVIKPGKAPLRHLTAAAQGDGGGPGESVEEAATLEQEIRFAGAEPILERLRERSEAEEQNVLLVVDQFEEIFRFGIHERNQRLRDEAADFVSVLLALAEESAVPVYVVLTMRADFIRDCDDVPELPEALNRSLFLVPRLTREQFREAIEGPVRWADAQVSPRLLDRLLNDSSREHDELPVLQHALLQTWREWAKEGRGALDSVHYERAGTAARALDQDAEAALEDLDEAGIDRVRRIFQALTAMDESNRKIRRPARLSELEEVTGLPKAGILPLLERFRSERRSLLVWSDADPDPLIDISHESLIRNWKRLSAWADEEAESVALYRRLALAAADYPDRGGLWRDPKLQIGLDWRERAAPTRTWAERVAPEADFEGAMRFLDESIRAREEARARRERERKEAHERELAQERAEHRLRGTRRILAASAAFLVVMAAITVYAFEQKRRAETLQSQQYLVFEASNELQTYPTHSLLLASGVLSHGLSREGVSDSGAGHLSSAQRLFLQALAHSGGRVAASGTGPFETLAVTPDGHRLVVVDGKGDLWCRELTLAGERGKLRRIAGGLAGRVTALATGGGPLLVGTEEGRILRLPAPPEGCPVDDPGELALVGWPVRALAGTPDGRWLAALGRKGELELRRLTGPAGDAPGSGETALRESGVRALAFGGGTNGPWLAIGHSSGRVDIRSLDEDGVVGSPVEVAPEGPGIETLAASGGSDLLLVARASAETTLFDLSDGPASPTAGVQLDLQERIVAAEMEPGGGSLVTWNSDGDIDLWDLTRHTPHRIDRLPPAGRSKLQAGAFSGKSDWLFTAHFLPHAQESPVWEVRRWSLAAFDPTEEILIHQLPQALLKKGIHRVAFSPDRDRAIVLNRAGDLGLWNLDPESPPEPVQGRRGVRAAAFAGDGRLLVAPWAGGVEVSPPDAGGSEGKGGLGRWASELATARLAELAVSRDGRLVMGAEEDGRLHVWDLETGEEIFAPKIRLAPPVVAAAFTPDGRRLVTAGPREAIRVHDLDGEEPGNVVEGSPYLGNILTLDVSPDGRRLATGGGDGVVRFWDLPAAGNKAVLDRRLTIELGGEPVVAVAFTPDGEDVLVTTKSGATRRWPVLWEDRYRLARELVGDGPVPREIRKSLQADTSQEIFDALLLDPEERPQEPPGDTVALAAEEGDPAGLLRPR